MTARIVRFDSYMRASNRNTAPAYSVPRRSSRMISVASEKKGVVVHTDRGYLTVPWKDLSVLLKKLEQAKAEELMARAKA